MRPLLTVLAFSISSDTGRSGLRTSPSAAAGGRGSTEQRIDRLERAVRDRPDDVDRLVALGSAFLRRARETGDAGDYWRAGRAITVALDRDPSNAGAYTARGVLRLPP